MAQLELEAHEDQGFGKGAFIEAQLAPPQFRQEGFAGGELLADVPSSQPNLLQHLATLYRAGFVRKRRQGSQIIYAIADERVVRVCQLMCSHSG